MIEQFIDIFEPYYLILRLTACFILGFWWCASGTLLQWTTQNPLACPVTLGLTALPVTLWLLSYLMGFSPENFTVLLILIILVLIFHIAAFIKYERVESFSIFSKPNFIMIGIGLNLSLAALYSFFHFFYSAQGKVLPNALWFGLLKNMDAGKFIILFVISVFFLIMTQKIMKQLTLLSLGLAYARNVCHVALLEKKMLIMVSVLLSVLVLTGGIFAFWGLILPHLVRKISYFRGSLVKEVYLGSSFAGLMMMFADYICYQYPISGAELPVGLLSSILGPILLIILLVRKRANSPFLS